MSDSFKGKTAEEWYNIASEIAADFADYQNLIGDRQRREREENIVFFAVEDQEGNLYNTTEDPQLAKSALEFYDESHRVVTWISTPRKEVTFS